MRTLVRHGRVRPNRRLLVALLLDLRDQRARHAQPADGVRIVELEAELLRVVVHLFDLFQLQRDESLVAAGEDLLRVESGGVANNILGLVLDLWYRLARESVVACADCANTEARVEEGVAAAGLGGFGGVAPDVLQRVEISIVASVAEVKSACLRSTAGPPAGRLL